jgi:hypothetical protein
MPNTNTNMICLNCKKQIPDDSDRCPHCGAEVFHKNQLREEIGFRRWQRWIFYALFILSFIGMVGIVVKIYNINSKLVLEIANVRGGLSQRESEIAKAKADLTALLAVRADLESQNKKISGDLAAKITEAEKILAEKTAAQTEASRNKAEADIYAAAMGNVAKSAAGISSADLAKIPLADAAYAGADSDGDGLPDNLEAALGANPAAADTDGDGYNDRAELLGGFNPLGAGGLPIDKTFAEKQKGKIFIEAGSGNLWYIGQDAKKYFLGK